jgi:DNA-binding MarR family transcriptional regulator
MSSIMRKKDDHVNHKGQASAALSKKDVAPDDILEAVHALMHAVRAHQHQASRDAGHELTPLEGRVLGFFARNPGATQRDLVTHSGRDKGQLARLIGSLRERGLMQAQSDEADRRALRLQLTDQGKSLHQAVRAQRQRLAATAASGLSAAERHQLLTLLERVRERLEAP